ncbi:hypothetical protein [Halobacillus litoralis]|nr:hypothetical protein [Halobacillus litoralis]
MFQLTPISRDLLPIEKKIHNSNPEYNKIAYNKEELSREDLVS